jgi:beta-lactam-binding protein with PASTA domain
VENFISRNIDEVRMDLMTLQAAAGGLPLLSIKEPLMYDFSSESPGTILAQKPEPLTNISGPISLEFVVSKGRENLTITVPQLTGLTLSRALEIISGTGINFQFVIKERDDNEAGETITAQVPNASSVVSANTPVQLTVLYPDKIADNEKFDLFKYVIPQNPYPLTVRLEAQLPSGEKQRLFTGNYMGGEFTIPYKLPAGSILILSMLNRELYRETVGSR